MTSNPETASTVTVGGEPPPAPARERVYTRAFILLFFMEFTIFVTFYMLLPTVPLYIKELGGTQSTVGWVIGIAGPVAAFGVPLYGLGVDRWSRRGMAVLGLAINVIGAIIMIFVLSPLMLLIPTILRRVGSGATGSATRTMILDIAPPNRRGEAMTNFATSHNIAIAFGPADRAVDLPRVWVDAVVHCLCGGDGRGEPVPVAGGQDGASGRRSARAG